MQSATVSVLVIASKRDPAATNIAQSLIKHHGFTKNPEISEAVSYSNQAITLLILEKEGIYVQPEDLPVRPTSIIFASKHRSSTNTPALTVHATGNLTAEALYGGNSEQVSMVEPFRIRQALIALKKEAETAGLEIDITMEATHHGPTSFPVPVCFVEIGSGPDQWQDPALGHVAANAIIAAASNQEGRRTNAVGFGGTHYSDKLTRMCTESDYQVGHIVPRRAFDANVSEQIISETFQKTVGLCKTALVDWKGLKSEQRRGLLDQLARWDIEAVRC